MPDPFAALQVRNTLHAKAILKDPLAAIPRESPMVIAGDPVEIPWTAAERESLEAADDSDLEALGNSVLPTVLKIA